MRPRRSAGVILSCLLAGCSPSNVDEPAAKVDIAELLECPTGDGPWRQAIGRATRPEALASLAAVAEQAAERCGDRWEPFWTLGEVRLRSRDRSARDPYEAALRLARALKDPVGIACAGNRIGVFDLMAGDFDPAGERFAEALSSARSVARDDLTAFVLNNMAALHKERGELPAAIVAFDEAIELLATLNQAKPARDAAYNQGVLLMELGDVAQAEAIFQRVHLDASEAGDGRTATMAALANGNLHLTIEDPGTAREWFARVESDDPRLIQSKELGLGRADLAEGRFTEAAARLQRAADLAAEHEFRIVGLLARAWRAHALWSAGRGDQAIEELTAVSAEAEAIGAHQKAVWFAQWLLGRIHDDLGEGQLSLESLRRAVEILESQGQRLDPLGAGLHFLLDRTDPYVDLALALVEREGATAELFAVVESSHARSLRRAISDSVRPASASASVESVQRSMQPDDLLLDYLLGRERGVMLALTRDEFRAVPIPGWQHLSGPLQRYRSALKRPLTEFAARARGIEDLRTDLDAGHELRDALLGPVEDLVRRARRIYTVPDRDLALLPFAALPLGDERFLADVAETAVLPMAGELPGWRRLDGPVLLGGDPTADAANRFSTLPRARLELDNIHGVWQEQAGRSLRAEEFTLDAFVSLPLDEYDAIHLATHAVASTLDPRKCAVVFSGGETLGFDRIARLELGPSLVVLSACRSGEGETIPGQGVVGLGWAFLMAGARGLVVSLWSVEDGSAADLMTEFHRRMHDGEDPVAALARARRWLREEHPHPAFWSPFVVYVRPGG